jgi:geranylgeranyl pyrophosphate synthase
MLDISAHAIELLHGASLIHDDIVDNAPHRRGVPALHKQVGPEVALVLGDYLLVRAYAVLGGMGDLAADAVSLVSRHAQRCCLGQAQELQLTQTTEKAYISTVSAKTGAVFAAAAELGVLAANGTMAQRAAARRYGESLGVAYQISDDVADLIEDTAIAATPIGSRLAGQRATLPLIYLAERGNIPLTGSVDPRECEHVLERLRATQRSYINAAVEALHAFEPSYEVGALGALAHLSAFGCAELRLGKEMGQEVAKPAW